MSFSNQYSHGKRHDRRFRYGWLLIAIMLVAFLAAVIVGYKKINQHPEWTHPVAEYYGRAATWVAERKQRLQETAAAVKKNVEVSNDPERVVNFEFYNTLADMKSMQVSVDADAAAAAAAVKKITPPKIQAKVSTKKSVRITRAADLERDLLATMKQQSGGKSK